MLGFDTSVFKLPKKQLFTRILFAFIGEFLLATGIAFNSSAGFGNDAVAVFYDGLHKCFNVSLGFATNITNIVLLIVVFIFGKKYLNIGTLIYVLPLGAIINFMLAFYNYFHLNSSLIGRIFSTVVGVFLLIIGLSFFIAADIGIDPWDGLALLLRDKTNIQYKYFKISMDILCLALGVVLGGKAGITTVIAAIIGGPGIQYLSEKLRKF